MYNINVFATKKLANSATLVLVVAMYSSFLVQSTQQMKMPPSALLSASLKHGSLAGQHQNRFRHDTDSAQKNNPPASTTQTTVSVSSTSKVGEQLNINYNCTKDDNRTECQSSSPTSKQDMSDPHYKLLIKGMAENRDMLMRTLYVTLGVTGVVVIYFVVRSLWLRRKHTKSRKYGVKPHRGGHKDMEMEPLGDGNDDDDDDDYTVFEANGRKK